MGLSNRYELKFARINATDDGDNVVVTNPHTQKSIVVLGYALVASGTGGVFAWESEGDVTHATFDLLDNGGVVYAGSFDCPAFQCNRGHDLELSCPTGTDGLGHLTYILV